ncbi:MAG: thioredoxin [Coriobacteriales bacterium]
MAAIEITAENFEQEVLKSEKPVLLDFWAVWCGPCMMLSPVVEEVAEEHPEVKVGKVNTDEQPALAQKFGITAIPALFVVKDGQIVNKSVGAVPKEQVEALIR